jgi:hypothetical protein
MPRRKVYLSGAFLCPVRHILYFCARGCLRRARGLIPLASPVAPQVVRSAVRFRAYGAAGYARSSAVQRAAGVSMNDALRVLRVQGDDLPARRRLFCFRVCMSPTGKGTDSPCIPRCATVSPVSCALSGVRGVSLCAEQRSTSRCRRIYERCDARIEGAGRSSPCPPEAVLFQVLYVSGGQGGMIPLASPVAPQVVRSAVRFRAYRAARYARSSAVQRAAGVSMNDALRALRVQGEHLPARRRLFCFRVCMSPTGKGD